MIKDATSRNKMNRRYFLQAAVTVPATLLLPRTLLAMTEAATVARSWAALQPLRPGMIRPEGWVRFYLEKQAAQLGYSLPDVSEPFTHAYWAGEEIYRSEEGGEAPWWAWEQKAYWIDGALRCGLLLGDEKLLRRAQEPVVFTMAHAADSGYLGPASLREPTADFHRWPHTVFFRALAALSDANGETGIVRAIRRHFLSDDADYGAPMRNVTNIEGMLWAYERTGDAKLLELAENAWTVHLQHAEEKNHGDMDPAKVWANAPIDSHGVSYAEISKLPAILYMQTGEKQYLRFALALQRRIFDRYMLVDGAPSTSEHYASTTSRDVHETCDIADHTWTWGYLLMATGDSLWADRIERACFNAGFGAIKKDWKGVQYFSCANQMLATQNSSHIPGSSPGNMAYQPNPGLQVACCAGNVHRIFPNYALRMWMRDPGGGLCATLYGPSRVKTAVGKGKQTVEIVETTGYPFSEEIHFKFDLVHPVSFSFSLRIPSWCVTPQLFLNDRPISLPQLKNGFAVLQRTFKAADEVTLILPMTQAVTRWPDGGVAIEHGPLVYSLPIKETWSSVVEPRWSTAEFPVWIAKPAGAWNYGIATDPAVLTSQVRVQRTRMTIDPWMDPPVKVVLVAKRIEGWELTYDPNNPTRMFSPPIPNLNPAKTRSGELVPMRDFLPLHSNEHPIRVAQTPEQIALVPYGSTHLRITVFPDVSHEQP